MIKEQTNHEWFDAKANKPDDRTWIVIEYISNANDETRGRKIQSVGYFSSVFNEYNKLDLMHTTCAEAVEPLRWRYV